MIDDKRGDGACEGLGDDDDGGGVQLEGKEQTFKPN